MLDTLTRESFLPYLEQEIRITPQDGEGFDAIIVEVTELGEEQAEASRRSYSVIFRGPKDRLLGQQICKVEIPGLGALDLFLVNIGPDADGMCYEAVFN